LIAARSASKQESDILPSHRMSFDRDFMHQVIIEDVLDRKSDLFFLDQLAISESIRVLRQAVDCGSGDALRNAVSMRA
jgi:hypothetical protein